MTLLDKYKGAEVLVSSQTVGFADAQWVKLADFDDYAAFCDFVGEEVFDGNPNWHVIDSVGMPECYVYTDHNSDFLVDNDEYTRDIDHAYWVLLDYLKDARYTLLLSEEFSEDFLNKMNRFTEESPGMRAERILDKLLMTPGRSHKPPFNEN